MNMPLLQTNSTASPFRSRYANFIGGDWREPVDGRYFQNLSPVNGQVI